MLRLGLALILPLPLPYPDPDPYPDPYANPIEVRIWSLPAAPTAELRDPTVVALP